MTEWRLDYTVGPSPESARLARLLATYQALVGHDLPNHLVAAQGLARLLSEADSLGPEELALATRLASLTREADARCRRLAGFGRLLRAPSCGPTIAVRDVLEEAVAVLATTGTGRAVRASADQARTRASQPLLLQALIELGRNAATAAPLTAGGEIRVEAAAVSGGVEVRVAGPGRGPTARPAALTPLDEEGPPPTAGLGLLLVHQAVARWRGRLAMATVGGECVVALFVPEGAEGGQER